MPNIIKKHIRAVANWPRKDILFQDITPMLQKPEIYRRVIDKLATRYKQQNIDKIVGIEARGFIFASMLAYELKVGFVPIRKSGKLPHKTIREDYLLEYGKDSLEIHQDAIEPGENIVLIDDILATGGTALAAINLLKKLKANIKECVFVIKIKELNTKLTLSDKAPIHHIVEI
jgi:adenine phosphoribosyltransferase